MPTTEYPSVFNIDNQLKQAQLDLTKQTLQNGKWDSWLKPIGVGIGAVNMGLNIGMYGTRKANLKAQTDLYKAQRNNLLAEQRHKNEVRKHNREVMR